MRQPLVCPQKDHPCSWLKLLELDSGGQAAPQTCLVELSSSTNAFALLDLTTETIDSWDGRSTVVITVPGMVTIEERDESFRSVCCCPFPSSIPS